MYLIFVCLVGDLKFICFIICRISYTSQDVRSHVIMLSLLTLLVDECSANTPTEHSPVPFVVSFDASVEEGRQFMAPQSEKKFKTILRNNQRSEAAF